MMRGDPYSTGRADGTSGPKHPGARCQSTSFVGFRVPCFRTGAALPVAHEFVKHDVVEGTMRLTACFRPPRLIAPALLFAGLIACGASASESVTDAPGTGTGTGTDGNGSEPTPVKPGSPAEPGATCDAPRTVCGGACVDTQSDVKHCGGCGSVCSGSKSCNAGKCRGPGTRWVKHFVGDTLEYTVNATTLDAAGNVYFAGTFIHTVDLGGGVMTGNGQGDLFVVSYTSSGAHRWSKHFGAGVNGAGAGALTTDASGHVHVGGWFHGNIDFGGGTILGAGGGDGFVLSLSAATGSFTKAWRVGSEGFDAISGIGVDAAGNVSVCGDFAGPTLDLGGGTTLAAGANAPQNAFVAGFDSNGSHRWSRRLGGATGFSNCRSLAVAALGTVVTVGHFQESTNLGAGTVTSAGDSDAFIAAFSGTGTPSFSRHFGGTGGTRAHGVALDASGNVFLTGHFNSDVDFGLGVVPADTIRSFVVGLSPNGATTRFARPLRAIMQSVATDPSGNVVLGGFFSAPADFGTGTLTPTGKSDALLLRLANADGKTLLARKFGGSNDDDITSVAAGSDLGISAAGRFLGAADFGTGTVNGSAQSNGFMMLVDP